MSDNEFPLGFIADMMNKPFVKRIRSDTSGKTLPYVHVSDLLKNHTNDQFCPREFVLRYFEKHSPLSGSVPAKMRLLWDTGNIIGDELIINRFMSQSVEYGHLVFGDWQCVACDNVVSRFSYRPEHGTECDECGCVRFSYKEVDLRETNVRLVGHPDLLIRLSDGTIYVYEIKTIDRQDIVFDEMDKPLGDHHLQASFYYYLLKRFGYRVHPHLRFIYIDRSLDNMYQSSPFKELGIDALPSKRIQPHIDKCKEIVDSIEDKILPNRICSTCNDQRARECSAVISCFARRSKHVKHLS